MQYVQRVSTLLAAGLLSLGTITAPAAASDASLPAAPRTLVLLNWSEYIDPELVQEFEQRFNAKVSEVYFESDDLRDDMMLETGSVGYDLVIVNGVNVDSYRKRGWIAPLDAAAIPNLRHVDKHWSNAFEGADGYAVPYF
jgi:spermidine/putrescine transport system substrate-binding protein